MDFEILLSIDGVRVYNLKAFSIFPKFQISAGESERGYTVLAGFPTVDA
jgi:hypothetical protein